MDSLQGLIQSSFGSLKFGPQPKDVKPAVGDYKTFKDPFEGESSMNGELVYVKVRL